SVHLHRSVVSEISLNQLELFKTPISKVLEDLGHPPPHKTRRIGGNAPPIPKEIYKANGS
ncbi:hypothetical protein SK128_011409, partial [Halocaridina rubra]